MASTQYIPWNEDMVCTLINLVITEGAHIAKKSEVTKKWNAVNDLFFEQNELLAYKSAYKKDDPRKLKDKFQKVMKATKADIDTGNQSGKSGEMSRRYELVQQVLNDIDADEEEQLDEKKKKEATAKALNDIEAKTLSNRPNPLKKRDLEGNILDNSDPTRKVKRDSFDDKLLHFLSGDTSSDKSNEAAVEDVVKQKLLSFVSSDNKTLEILLEEAGIRNADEDTVEILFDIGIEVMIDIYCTRGWNFGAEKFKDSMMQMQLKPIVAHKLYRTLEKWRLFCKPVHGDTPLMSSSNLIDTTKAKVSFSI